MGYNKAKQCTLTEEQLKAYADAHAALKAEYRRSLCKVDKGYRKAFAADGYSLINASPTVLRGTFAYRAAQELWESDVLVILPEPTNRYDKQAIAAYDWDYQLVGYLAEGSKIREDARAAIESGAMVFGIVTESTMGDNDGIPKDAWEDRVREKAKALIVCTDADARYERPESEPQPEPPAEVDSPALPVQQAPQPAPAEKRGMPVFGIVTAIVLLVLIAGFLLVRCS